MIKFKIYFTVNDVEDYFIVEASDVNKAIKAVRGETEKRGLDSEKNHMWIEEI